MKIWTKCHFRVNGFEIEAKYSENAIHHIFLPVLERFTKMQEEKKERLIVFLAAPPAVGKTTLTLFLENLAESKEHLARVQSVGLDGFHYHTEYIQSHTVERWGKKIPMKQVKGCPETFDAVHFLEKVRELKQGDPLWPIYDRNIHDVVEDAVRITAPVVIIEGNWLLLDESPWKECREMADYTILIRSGEEMLRERLIQRKMKGGLSREEALAWYLESESVNVKRALACSAEGDMILIAEEDGDYRIDSFE
ncbi:MAG: nucleoside/nucleotide kinase family protein [Clostridiales bacterium]|nr:nucleoside/nucleotide kinase family protein [Clostridiales bacterium]